MVVRCAAVELVEEWTMRVALRHDRRGQVLFFRSKRTGQLSIFVVFVAGGEVWARRGVRGRILCTLSLRPNLDCQP